jgi:low temperature requirement protein LtrA
MIRLERMAEGASERRATWTELLFDLVFVVIVAELAHRLKQDLDGARVGAFAFLFLPAWWAWIGSTFYANRFDRDDLTGRLFVLLEMLAAAALAVSVHDALDTTSRAFAIAYVAARVILIALYLLAARRVPGSRALAHRYAAGFALAAALWLASVWVAPPWRFALWGAGMLIDLVTPLTARRIQATLPLDTAHLPERFGLFTLIVMGESVVGAVQGVAGRSWDLPAAVAGMLGMVLVFSVWWSYFENMVGTAIRRTLLAGQVWVYGHLPLVMSLAALGAGLQRAVSADPAAALPVADRWLIAGALASALASMAVIDLATRGEASAVPSGRRAAIRLVGAAAAALTGLLAAGLPPPAFIGCLAAVAAGLVAADLRLRARPR